MALQAVNAVTRNVALSTTFATVLDSDQNRKHLTIQNRSGIEQFIFIGEGTASTASSYSLAAGAAWSPLVPPLGKVQMSSASGTPDVIVLSDSPDAA